MWRLSVMKKCVAIVLITIVLTNISTNFLMAASDPYKDLKNWLEQNLSIVAFTLYRGPVYPVIGEHEEPKVGISLYDYNTKQKTSYILTYSDFVKNYLLGENKFKLSMNMTFFGEPPEEGPIVRYIPSYSFIYNKTPNFLFYEGGSYFYFNVPTDATQFSEGDVSINSFTFNLSQPIFYAHPAYLYSYMELSNGSSLTLPKGEDVILALTIKDSNSFSILQSLLEDKGPVPYPNSLSPILRNIPEDDISSTIFNVEWSVGGNNGYLKNAIIQNYQAMSIKNYTFVGSLTGFYVVCNPNESSVKLDSIKSIPINGIGVPKACEPKRADIENMYKQTVEKYTKLFDQNLGSLGVNNVEFKIFAPYGTPNKSITNLIDLSTNVSELAKTSSVFFIINPNAFQGEETVKVSIKDVKERINLNFNIKIEIGNERFTKLDSEFYYYEAAHKTGESYNSNTYRSGNIKLIKENYDEDGSLILQLSTSESYSSISKEEVGYVSNGIRESTDNSQELGKARIKVGGWLPNPAPPGLNLQVTNYTAEFKSFHTEQLTHTLTTGTSTYYLYIYEWGSCGYNEKEGQICDGGISSGVRSISSSMKEFNYTDYGGWYDIGSYTSLGLLSISNGADFLIHQTHSGYISHTWNGFSYESEELKTETLMNHTEYYHENVTTKVIRWNSSSTYFVVDTVVLKVIPNAGYSEEDYWKHYIGGSLVISYPLKASQMIPAISAEEPSQLFLFPSKHNVFPSDKLDITIRSFGEGSSNLNIQLVASLVVAPSEMNSTRIPIFVSPSNVKTDSEGKARVTVSLPSLTELKNMLGSKLVSSVKSGLLFINATDSRGVKGSTVLTFYVSGAYIVFNLRDLALPILDPWKENVLDMIDRALINDVPLDVPLKLDGYITIYIKDKKTGDVIYQLSPKDNYQVYTYEELGLKQNSTYIIGYDLAIRFTEFDWFTLKVKDIGVDLTIPQNVTTSELIKKEIKIYTPYSLLKQYKSLADALSGKDSRYYKILADQAIVNLLLKILRDFSYRMPAGSSAAVKNDVSDTQAAQIFNSLLNSYNETIAYLKPTLSFPTLGQENKLIKTELDPLNTELNFRYYYYNLTYDPHTEAPFSKPDNYWSKLAKFVIFQAELLRTYKYAMNSILVTSKLVALAVTLDYFKGFFEGKRFLNNKNIFAEYSKKYPGSLWELLKLDKLVNPAVGLGAKIALLTLEGAFFTFYSLIGSSNPMFKKLKDWFGSNEMASIIVALSFKIIRFVLDLFFKFADLLADLYFEVIFQLIATFVAHLLMFLYNSWSRFLVMQELYIKPYIDDEVTILIKAIINPSQLIKPTEKPFDKTWQGRSEKYGVYDSISRLGSIESVFFNVADTYSNLETATGLLLSIVRGLDGVAFKWKNTKLAKLTNWYSTVINIGKVSINLKDLIPRAYAALTAAILTDMVIKGIYVPAIKKALISGNELNEFLAMGTTILQVLVPPLVAFLTLRFTKFASFSGNPLLVAYLTSLTKDLGYDISAINTQDEDINRLSSLANEIGSLRLSFLDMANQAAYDFETISNMMDKIGEANLIVKRTAFRVTSESLQSELLEMDSSLMSLYFVLITSLNTILNNPSIRQTKGIASLINDALSDAVAIINAVKEILNNASQTNSLLNNLGPAIVVRSMDIYSGTYLYNGSIIVMVNNVGDTSANVRLRVLETDAISSYESETKMINARSSTQFILKPALKSTNINETILNIVINVNGEDIDTVSATLPLYENMLYYASGENIIVKSDGPVSIDNSVIKVNNAHALHIIVPKSVADPRFLVTLNGNLVRSGEVRFKDFTLIGVTFNNPISGNIQFKSIKQTFEYIEGTGTKSTQSGVTFESDGKFAAQVSLFQDNPFPEASLSEAEKVKFIAIDLLSAEKGYVTVKISFGDLGITDASQLGIYKYNAQKEAYEEFKNYTIDMQAKVVVLQIKPGDPVFALTKGKIITGGGGGGTTSKTESIQLGVGGFNLMNILPYFLISAITIMVIILIIKRRNKRIKNN
ncbi:MAG: hypothetical protein ACP5IZ_08050 [Thermoprotei archaeon]